MNGDGETARKTAASRDHGLDEMDGAKQRVLEEGAYLVEITERLRELLPLLLLRKGTSSGEAWTFVDPITGRSTASPPRVGHLALGFLSALGGIRTPNLLIRSQMLYPLSYERRLVVAYRWSPGPSASPPRILPALASRLARQDNEASPPLCGTGWPPDPGGCGGVRSPGGRLSD